MKIVIATDNYPPRYDGISRFLQEIIPSLTKDHEVHVIAPDFGPTEDDWPVTKIPVTRIRIGDYHPAGIHFIKIYRRMKGDVLFLQTLGSIGLLALIAAKIRRMKVVLYTHSIEWELVPKALKNNFFRRTMPNVMKGIDRILYSWINLLIVPSTSISEKYYWNKIENKRVVVHLGVDTKKFVPAKDKAAAKKKLGLPEEALIVGYHGRLAREKDLKTLLRGYLRFKAKHPNKKTHLLIVGDGLRSIRQLFNRSDATVTGFKENVIPYLQAMDIYAHTSTTETSCLSVMEAMSCSLPVITTPAGFIQDYIKDEKNGLLIQEKDTVMLERQLTKLINKKTRERFGEAARKTITKKFSWNRTRKKIEETFRQL